MKTILLAAVLLITTTFSQAQPCEEREEKFLKALGGVSAVTLYNSYMSIGSATDAFAKDAYDSTMVIRLMTAQTGLMDNLAQMFETMIKEGAFVNEADKTYMQEIIHLLRSLKKQAQLLITYTRKGTTEASSQLNLQRQQNWDGISKLLGQEDDAEEEE